MHTEYKQLNSNPLPNLLYGVLPASCTLVNYTVGTKVNYFLIWWEAWIHKRVATLVHTNKQTWLIEFNMKQSCYIHAYVLTWLLTSWFSVKSWQQIVRKITCYCQAFSPLWSKLKNWNIHVGSLPSIKVHIKVSCCVIGFFVCIRLILL